MMFRTNIQDTDAMIFVFPQPYQASFWMKNCPESISAAYIDPDGVIQEIHHLEKNDTNGVVAASANIQFVLETSDGWFARHHVNIGMVIRTEKGSLAETFFAEDDPVRRLRQIHRFAGSGGFVNGHHDFHVAQAFFAGNLGRAGFPKCTARSRPSPPRTGPWRGKPDRLAVAAPALDAAVTDRPDPVQTSRLSAKAAKSVQAR